jgi:hypothetical protein
MYDPAYWYEWIKVAAFVFGLAFGGLAIGSPAWVWLKKQLLTATAGLLAALGTILISMSIWQSVEIEAAGLKLRIAELSKALEAQLALAEEAAPQRSANAIASVMRMWELEPGVTYTQLKEVPGLEEAYKDYLTKSDALERSAEQLTRRAEDVDILKRIMQAPIPGLGAAVGEMGGFLAREGMEGAIMGVSPQGMGPVPNRPGLERP